mgnify:CR=1 FL=1
MILLDLLKQRELIADESLTYFSTDAKLLTEGSSEFSEAPFARCRDLRERKFPTYRFDNLYRIVPTKTTKQDTASRRLLATSALSRLTSPKMPRASMTPARSAKSSS